MSMTVPLGVPKTWMLVVASMVSAVGAGCALGKSRGYRFVGHTSVYAFMQNVGVVNDHIHGCFRAVDYTGVPRGH